MEKKLWKMWIIVCSVSLVIVSSSELEDIVIKGKELGKNLFFYLTLLLLAMLINAILSYRNELHKELLKKIEEMGTKETSEKSEEK